jgi:hypothetical protein
VHLFKAIVQIAHCEGFPNEMNEQHRMFCVASAAKIARNLTQGLHSTRFGPNECFLDARDLCPLFFAIAWNVPSASPDTSRRNTVALFMSYDNHAVRGK